MEFINILNKLLQERGISGHKLAQDLGLGKNAYTSWRDRGNIPSGEVLANIADYFNVSIDYLLGREEYQLPELTGRKDLDVLFDLAKDAPPEDVQFAVDLLQKFRENR